MPIPLVRSSLSSFMTHSLRQLNEGSIDFSANSPKSLSLARVYCISRLIVRLTGAVTVTTNATAVKDIWNIVKSLQLKVNTKDVRINVEGWMLRHLSWRDNGRKPLETQPTGVTSTGSKTFDVWAELPLDFTPQSYFSPLNSTNFAGVKDLSLEVTWGDFSDAITGGAGSIASSTKLEVYSVNIVTGTSNAAQQNPGGTNRLYPKRYIDFTKLRVTQTQSDLLALDGMPGVGYHAFHAFVLTGSTPARSEAILNGYKLKYRNDVLSDVKAAAMRAQNVDRYEISSTDLTTETLLKGAYWIDLIDPYMFGQMQATALNDAANLRLYFDVTVADAATDTIYLIRDTFQA